MDVHALMVFSVVIDPAQLELEIRRERITDSRICNAVRLIEGGELATQVARDLGC